MEQKLIPPYLTRGYYNDWFTPCKKEQTMKYGDPVIFQRTEFEKSYSIGIYIGKVRDSYAVCTNIFLGEEGAVFYKHSVILVDEVFPYNNLDMENLKLSLKEEHAD